MRNSADVEREHGLATSALHGKGRLVPFCHLHKAPRREQWEVKINRHISLHKACDQGLASSLSRILKAEEIKRLLFFFPCFFTMDLARSLSFQFPWSWQVSRDCPSPCFEALGPPHSLERKQHLRGAAS
ncbi:hypothetical protein Peur_027762 [Populus x canadensis]